MKIATWNIERLKHAKKLSEIVQSICDIDADILVLTESVVSLNLDYKFSAHTSALPSDYYSDSERRITIHSKFEIIGYHLTYDGCTAVCPEIMTPLGKLLVYGTIIGVHGNRRPSFKEDLEKQLIDYKRLGKQNMCIAGDFNLSFSDNYYFTKFGRDTLNQSFHENEMLNTTAGLTEAIDHICISSKFLGNRKFSISEWNLDKSLSDHKGVCIELQ